MDFLQRIPLLLITAALLIGDTTGQVLNKLSGTDYDWGWLT